MGGSKNRIFRPPKKKGDLGLFFDFWDLNQGFRYQKPQKRGFLSYPKIRTRKKSFRHDKGGFFSGPTDLGIY